jgi:hypothetical protein
MRGPAQLRRRAALSSHPDSPKSDPTANILGLTEAPPHSSMPREFGVDLLSCLDRGCFDQGNRTTST